MANATTPHGIEQHRRLKNVRAYEIDKHSSPPPPPPPPPPIIFRHRSSHLTQCPSISSSSTLSPNTTTTSSSSLSSSNCLEENHIIMFNKNIITNNNTNPLLLTSPPAISFPSRIPFSWEKLPGIPKHQKQNSKKKLPLPPGTRKTKGQSCNSEAYSSKRYSICSSEEMMGSFLEDPFFMAMIECSKEKNRRETRKMVTTRRSFSSIVTSHLNIYGSCKSSSSCSVSESSIVRRLPSTKNSFWS